ncbi:hypothetical protein BJ322DRAFT_607095 [Thelephora terrestris]|uniref:Polysaccharide lyase 14 domain-containing protein n=1 Tax=Thelephora terrestris TaxID=56493 RepID=A0A9P6L9J7_9AGAM|nr:hypothetical protein BJ322DRAFT_607095 [Thelephora terrestris]
MFNKRSHRGVLLFTPVLSSLAVLASASMIPPDIASQYSLSTSTTLPFPSSTQSNSDTQDTILQGWSISRGRIQQGTKNIAFVPDPFPDYQLPSSASFPSPSGPVLQVTYPSGGSGSSGSGAQFYSLWNSTGAAFKSMLLSYEVAFDSRFDWVQGGKLPGLRGGPDPNTCDGGSQSDGTCFSTRIMWRKSGDGEVYAYILNPNNLCSDQNVQCNDDYGISFGRGDFRLQAGKWNRISLLVQLNGEAQIANGQIQVFYNDVLAITHQNLQFHGTFDLSIGGLFFSTFYGGSDSSWAPSNTTHAYFRNVQLWGGSSASSLTEQKGNGVPSAPSLSHLLTSFILFMMCFLRWLT